MDTNGAVILCVEDEAEIRRDLVDELLDAGYEVHEAGSGSEARKDLFDESAIRSGETAA